MSPHFIQAAVTCGKVTALRTDCDEAEQILLITGSLAEFYIQPILPHIGDIDVMYYSNTQLAIPRGHPRPTKLPAEFHNYVKVYEIIDSHLPGYVYLELRYLLTERIDDGLMVYMPTLSTAAEYIYPAFHMKMIAEVFMAQLYFTVTARNHRYCALI